MPAALGMQGSRRDTVGGSDLGFATPLWPVINVVWFESATQGNFDLRANVREITFRQAKDSHELRNVQRSEVHDC